MIQSIENNWNSPASLVRTQSGAAILGKSLAVSYNVEHTYLPHDSATTYIRDMKTYVYTNTWYMNISSVSTHNHIHTQTRKTNEKEKIKLEK